MFGKLATKAVSGLLALALGITMCPAAGLAFAAEGEGQQSSSNTANNSTSTNRVNQDVSLSAGNEENGALGTEVSAPSDDGEATDDSSSGNGSSEVDGADSSAAQGSAVASGNAKYINSINGQTSADVSLNGEATVGTIEYNGLAYTINENDAAAVSVTGLASTKPTGDVQIPAQIASGDRLYTVTGISVPDMPKAVNPYAERLFDNADKALAVKTVSIPETVESVNPAFFQLFPNATDINVASESEAFTSYNGVLYSADMTQLILVPQGKGSLVLPETLATVPAYVLSQSDKLSAISFPGSTGNETFAVWNNVLYTSDYTTLLAAPAGLGASVTIAPECATIAEGAFYGNSALETIVVNGVIEGIAKAGEVAEDGEGEALLLDSKFNAGTATLPAFNDAAVANATVVLNIADTGEGGDGEDGDTYAALLEQAKAAWLAYGFASFKEPATPGTEIEPAGGSGFAFTLLPDYTLSVRWAGPTEPPAAIDIPDYGIIDGVQYTVSTIADEGFSNYTSIITADLPQTITNIGNSAFSGATNLQTIRFDSVTTIGELAFSNTALLSLVLPTTVQTIGANAFSNMKGTTIVALGYIEDNSPIALGAASGLSVYAPLGTEDNWDAGIPAYGNHIYPYGVQLSQEPLELEVGQTANITDNGGYIEAPGDVEVNYAYNAKPMSLDPETGEIEVKGAGSSSINVTLNIALSSSVVKRAISNEARLEKTADLMVDPGRDDAEVTVVEENMMLSANTLAAVFMSNAAADDGISAQADSTEDEMVIYEPISGTTNCSVRAKDKSIAGDIIIDATHKIDDTTYTVTQVQAKGFFQCLNITSVYLPNTITSIGISAFEQCYSLRSINVPNSVVTIDTYAFWGNPKLESIYIPASATKIGGSIVGACSSMKSIEVDAANSVLKSIDGVLYKKLPDNKLRLIAYPSGKDMTVFTIPDNVTELTTYSIAESRKLKCIYIPSSVTSIEGHVFSNCTSLEKVYVFGAPSVDTSAFSPYAGLNNYFGDTVSLANKTTVYVIDADEQKKWNNLNPKPAGGAVVMQTNQNYLKFRPIADKEGECEVYVDSADINNIVGTLVIPSTWIDTSKTPNVTYKVTNVVDKAFYGFNGITSVYFPDSIERVGVSSFEQCNNLESVNIGSSIKTLDTYAFWGCPKLESMRVPATLQVLGDSAFSACRSLTSIELDEGNDLFVVIDGVLYQKLEDEKLKLLSFPSGKQLETFTIPDNVTSIGTWGLAESRNLKYVYIPPSITHISHRAFANCVNLEEFYIYSQNKVTADDPFAKYTGVNNMIGDYADVPNKITVYVVANENVEYWNDIATPPTGGVRLIEDNSSLLSFQPIADKEGECEVFVRKADKPNISGTVIVPSTWTDTSKTPNVTYKVTAVGFVGFKNCAGITSAHLPDTITTLGYGAFEQCAKLKSVNYPSGLKTIDTYAFWGCPLLESANIPATISKIGDSAFSACASLKEIKLNSPIEGFTVRDGVLYNLDSDGKLILQSYPSGKDITSFVVPSDCKELASWSMAEARKLTTISLPEGLESVGDHAFSNCINLKEVLVYGNPDTIRSAIFGPYSGYEDMFGTTEELANVATVYVTTKDIKEKWDNAVKSPAPKGGVVVMTEVVRVTFSGNAGGAEVENLPNPSTMVVTKGGTLERPYAVPTRNGAEFVDWYTVASPSSTDQPFAFGSDKISSNMTLFAKWNLIEYTITLDKKDGSTPQVSNYNIETASITVPDPTCAGFTFDGWTGTGLSAKTKNLIIPIGSYGDRSYTANWTANTYSVTLDSNIPSGGVYSGSFEGFANLKVTSDGTPTGTKTSVALPKATDSSVAVQYQGHSLAASGTWTSDTSATATGVKKYADSVNLQQLVSDGLAASGNKITLFAQWTERSYKVAYNMGDSRTGIDASAKSNVAPTGVTTAVAYSKANGFTIASDASQKMLGYTFAGWKASIAGDSEWTTGKIFSSAAINGVSTAVAPTTISALLAPADASLAADKVFPDDGATIVLTAQWKPVTYTINYEQDSALVHPDAAKLAAAAPQTDSKTFTIENVLGKNVADGTVAKDNACVPVNNLLALDGYTFGGFKGGQTEVVLPVSSTLASNAITLDRFKKLFGTASNTTGGTADTTVEVTAQWTPWTYTISWDKGAGDSGSKTDAEVEFTDAIGVPTTGFAKSGYSLSDWQTGEANASVKSAGHVYDIVYACGDYGSASVSGNPITVTAIWTADGKQFTVNYWFEKAGDHTGDVSQDYEIVSSKRSPDGTAGVVTDATIDLTADDWKGAYLPGNDGSKLTGNDTLGKSGYTYVLDDSKNATYKVKIAPTGANVVDVYYKLTDLKLNLAAGDKGAGSGATTADGWDAVPADTATQAANIDAARSQAYELTGWVKTSGAPTDAKVYTTEELASYKVRDNETFTAQWKLIDYKLTYAKDDAGHTVALPAFADVTGEPNVQLFHYTDFYNEDDNWAAKSAPSLAVATDAEEADNNAKMAFGYYLNGWNGGAADGASMKEAVFEDLFGEGGAPERTATVKADAKANTYTFKYYSRYSLGDESETIHDDMTVSMDTIGAGSAAYKAPTVADVNGSDKPYGYMFSNWYVLGADSEVQVATPSPIEDAAALEAFLKPIIAASGYSTADIPVGGAAHAADLKLTAKWVAVYKVSLPVGSYDISADASNEKFDEGDTAAVVNASPRPLSVSVYSEVEDGKQMSKAKALFLNDIDATDNVAAPLLDSVRFAFAKDDGGAEFEIDGGPDGAATFADNVPAATSATETGSISGEIKLDLSANDQLWQNVFLATAKLAGATDFEKYAELGISRTGLSVNWGPIANITWVATTTDGDLVDKNGKGTKEYYL